MSRASWFAIFSTVVIYSSNVYAEDAIEVPTDAKAQYFALSVSDVQLGIVEIVSKRIGPSGTSFAKRHVNCNTLTFKYIGDGDTIEEMESSKPMAKFSPLVTGSISYYVTEFACKKAGMR